MRPLELELTLMCGLCIRVLIEIRRRAEQLLHLGSAMLAGELPDIADGHDFERRAFGRHMRHVDMALASAAAAELSQADTIIGAQYSRVRAGCQSGG